MAKYGLKTWDAVLAAIGHGGLKEGQVVNKLVEEYKKDHKKQETDKEALAAIEEKSKTNIRPVPVRSKSGITVKGADDVSVRFSKCCAPVPGDEIIGFVTRGRGISIHRTDCSNIVRMPEEDRSRLIDAEWEENASAKTGELYLAEISIYAHNRTGIFVDISKIFLELKVDIASIQTRTSKQGLKTLELSFEISGIEELNHIIKKIRNVESVIAIERATG
jgi:GTP pyrophosphokinase